MQGDDLGTVYVANPTVPGDTGDVLGVCKHLGDDTKTALGESTPA